jgi:hypothetical protein
MLSLKNKFNNILDETFERLKEKISTIGTILHTQNQIKLSQNQRKLNEDVKNLT